MGSPVAERFGQNVRRERRRVGLTQEGLRDLAEVGRTEVGVIERGERLPGIDTVLRLAGGLGVSPCVLLAGLRWRAGRSVQSDGGFEVTER